MILRPVMQYSFNPRTPRGVRPGLDCPKVINYRFQSTHPARGATGQQEDYHLDQQVSIHAPREGCDSFPLVSPLCVICFNPRTPRGVRPWCAPTAQAGILFQSTHPARGATGAVPAASAGAWAISIHAPREGCDFEHNEIHVHTAISIHAPREGCDSVTASPIKWTMVFQSTHPARGATPFLPSWLTTVSISIHAPREGCDLRTATVTQQPRGFNPRTPRGVRQVWPPYHPSILPVSIHAPREGCDW